MYNACLKLMLGQNDENGTKITCIDSKLNQPSDLDYITFKGPQGSIFLTLWNPFIKTFPNMEKRVKKHRYRNPTHTDWNLITHKCP